METVNSHVGRLACNCAARTEVSPAIRTSKTVGQVEKKTSQLIRNTKYSSRFADFAEFRKQSLPALDRIYCEECRQCFKQWERRWDCCIQSLGGGRGAVL